jgi:hypothetical protein
LLLLLLPLPQEYVDLAAADSYLMAAGAQALVSSKAGRAAKVIATAAVRSSHTALHAPWCTVTHASHMQQQSCMCSTHVGL